MGSHSPQHFGGTSVSLMLVMLATTPLDDDADLAQHIATTGAARVGTSASAGVFTGPRGMAPK